MVQLAQRVHKIPGLNETVQINHLTAKGNEKSTPICAPMILEPLWHGDPVLSNALFTEMIDEVPSLGLGRPSTCHEAVSGWTAERVLNVCIIESKGHFGKVIQVRSGDMRPVQTKVWANIIDGYE